ncbi:MAG: hypothetical protein IPM02_10640 [Betaproteobacteria bacterium]|nr:hypothetical protein [Betaproteobacteria bacterium]
MKAENLSTTLAVSCILLLAHPAGFALAHTQNGSLGDAAGATDYYQISCTDDGNGVPASFVAQVTNRSPVAAQVVSVLVHRGIAAVNSTDTNAGDSAGSPVVFVNGGDGVYNVFVIKTGPGGENYTITFHCMTEVDGGGIHTGTTIVFRQNQ